MKTLNNLGINVACISTLSVLIHMIPLAPNEFIKIVRLGGGVGIAHQ